MSVKVCLKEYDGDYTIAQLPAAAPIPRWADGPGFVSISRTEDELSVACRSDRVPPEVKSDTGWRSFKFVGPFPFEAVGIITAVIGPLSATGMGVFVVATFDGDVLMLKNKDLPRAKSILSSAGHSFQ